MILDVDESSSGDQSFVDRLLEGDESAWELQRRRVNEMVARLSLPKWIDRAAIASDTLCELFLALPRLREAGSLDAFTRSIAKRCARDEKTRCRRFARVGADDTTLAGKGNDTESERDNDAARVTRVLDAVSERDRELLEEFYLGGRDAREIARERGVTRGTIWKHLALARRHARDSGDPDDVP